MKSLKHYFELQECIHDFSGIAGMVRRRGAPVHCEAKFFIDLGSQGIRRENDWRLVTVALAEPMSKSSQKSLGMMRWMLQPMRGVPMGQFMDRSMKAVRKSLGSTPARRWTRKPKRQTLAPATERTASKRLWLRITRAMAWVPQNLRSLPIAEMVERTRRHRCPYCHGHEFRRSRPRSVEGLLCLVRVIPYRCLECNRRFFGLELEFNPFAE